MTILLRVSVLPEVMDSLDLDPRGPRPLSGHRGNQPRVQNFVNRGVFRGIAATSSIAWVIVVSLLDLGDR